VIIVANQNPKFSGSADGLRKVLGGWALQPWSGGVVPSDGYAPQNSPGSPNSAAFTVSVYCEKNVKLVSLAAYVCGGFSRADRFVIKV